MEIIKNIIRLNFWKEKMEILKMSLKTSDNSFPHYNKKNKLNMLNCNKSFKTNTEKIQIYSKMLINIKNISIITIMKIKNLKIIKKIWAENLKNFSVI